MWRTGVGLLTRLPMSIVLAERYGGIRFEADMSRVRVTIGTGRGARG